jgi:hypothetical protein
MQNVHHLQQQQQSQYEQLAQYNLAVSNQIQQQASTGQQQQQPGAGQTPVNIQYTAAQPPFISYQNQQPCGGYQGNQASNPMQSQLQINTAQQHRQQQQQQQSNHNQMVDVGGLQSQATPPTHHGGASLLQNQPPQSQQQQQSAVAAVSTNALHAHHVSSYGTHMGGGVSSGGGGGGGGGPPGTVYPGPMALNANPQLINPSQHYASYASNLHPHPHAAYVPQPSAPQSVVTGYGQPVLATLPTAAQLAQQQQQAAVVHPGQLQQTASAVLQPSVQVPPVTSQKRERKPIMIINPDTKKPVEINLSNTPSSSSTTNSTSSAPNSAQSTAINNSTSVVAPSNTTAQPSLPAAPKDSTATVVVASSTPTVSSGDVSNKNSTNTQQNIPVSQTTTTNVPSSQQQ